MRLLLLVLTATLLVAVGAREASAVSATGPCAAPLTAVQVDDRRPLVWHFEHRGARVVAVSR